jgi:lysozyme family protein
MNADFRISLIRTLKKEGVQFDSANNPLPGKTGYVNDPDDPGCETNYGITKKTAVQNGYLGSMIEMTWEFVQYVYRVNYWEKVGGDENPDQDIANELFDTAVNCGPEIVVGFLQRVLNVMNNRGTIYQDLLVDGICGEITVGTLKNALLRGSSYMRWNILKALNAFQGVRYIELAEKNSKLEKYVGGWFQIRID